MIRSKDKEDHSKDTIILFDKLGFVIHPHKSVMIPTQEITYLGFVLNSTTMTIKLSDERRVKVIQACEAVLDGTADYSIRNVARLVGLLISCFPAVKMGPLNYRCTEKEKVIALNKSNGNWDSFMLLSNEAKYEVHWWLKTIQGDSSGYTNTICTPNPDIIITSDSSLKGWGAYHKTLKPVVFGHLMKRKDTLMS